MHTSVSSPSTVTVPSRFGFRTSGFIYLVFKVLEIEFDLAPFVIRVATTLTEGVMIGSIQIFLLGVIHS